MIYKLELVIHPSDDLMEETVREVRFLNAQLSSTDAKASVPKELNPDTVDTVKGEDFVQVDIELSRELTEEEMEMLEEQGVCLFDKED